MLFGVNVFRVSPFFLVPQNLVHASQVLLQLSCLRPVVLLCSSLLPCLYACLVLVSHRCVPPTYLLLCFCDFGESNQLHTVNMVNRESPERSPENAVLPYLSVYTPNQFRPDNPSVFHTQLCWEFP